MKAVTAKLGGWSRGRFVTVVAVLFVAQAGLVLLFAARERPMPVTPPDQTVFRKLAGPLDAETLSKYIFAEDPTIFPSSSPHGFAEQAWLRVPPVEYNKATNDAEPPSFLEFAANPFGASVMARPGPRQDRIPFELVGGPEPAQEPAPIYAVADGSRPGSFFRIEGALAGRQIDAAMRLREWANSAVLSNTVVRFGVTRAGEVVSARLWNGSGLPDADASAVATVSGWRFAPGAKSAEDPAWDTATFYWRTVAPPPGTNAPGTTGRQ